MLEYFCRDCNVPMDTSECTKCNSKTIMSSTLYWCPECNIPIHNKLCSCCGSNGKYISTDIRPVFPKESLLIAILLEKETPLDLMKESIWNGNNSYIINGEKIRIPIAELNRLPLEEIKRIKAVYDEYVEKIDDTYFKKIIEKFILANKIRYDQINEESVRYIRGFQTKYSIDDMFVSFSGGKDSTVISHLVTKALGTNKVLHIFGDTTLEFEKTYEYKARFRKNEESLGIPMVTAKNIEKNFEELCETIGPPSRVMRWCCTVFKTGAISKTIESVFKDKTNILTFYGIRKSESTSRSKYDRESDSPKISKQTVVAPIIDWIDFDVWLYIFTEKIDFNEAYEMGFSRVGCWCCPNNGNWSEFLAKVHTYEKAEKWRNLLVDFAIQIEKPDPEEYIDGGNWKARQGGNGLEIAQTSVLKFQQCAVEENTFNYELQKPITEELYELFKPFGYLNKELGNKRLGEVYIMDKKGLAVLILQGRIGSIKLKVKILNQRIAGSTNMLVAEKRIQCQLTKYQMCMGCKACVGICKHNAITIRENSDGSTFYRIDDEKCIRCGDCVAHFNAGCYMRKVLTIKRG